MYISSLFKYIVEIKFAVIYNSMLIKWLKFVSYEVLVCVIMCTVFHLILIRLDFHVDIERVHYKPGF